MAESSCRTNSMNETLRALLSGILDYAGLFPPAKLPLDAALTNYQTYVHTDARWMLARFICPAAKLSQLAELVGAMRDADPASMSLPMHLSVLGNGGAADREEFIRYHRQDLLAMDTFRRESGSLATFDAFEVRLPPVDGGADGVSDFLLSVRGSTSGGPGNADRLPEDLPLFVEVLGGDDWRQTWNDAIGGISRANESRPQGSALIGFKLRCGGVEPSQFPAVDRVAFVIAEAAKQGVPLKFTAGLHHPLRHFNKAMGCEMHGFVNVFVASMLAHRHALDSDEVGKVLVAERWEDFSFSDVELGFGEWTVDRDAVGDLRRTACLSYGSCSFDEPREDLEEAGLL